MEIQKSSAIQSISSNANQPPKDFSRMPAGSSLNAVVVDKAEDNTYTLKLSDGRLVRAHTDSELQPGQVLKLEVIKSGAIPELKIVLPEHTGSTTPLVLQNALRQLLPKQVNLTDFALALRQIASSSTAKNNPVNTAIQELLGSLLTKEDLMTEEGVKQAFNNSGAFLEAKLAHQLSPQGDIKAQLLALANALQKTSSAQVNPGLAHTLPDQLSAGLDPNNLLLAKTEGAIARIVLDQLASLPQINEPQTTWQIGIPFTDGAHTDTVNLKIKREDNSNPAYSQPNWSVVLELNPPGMGVLHCKISLFDDKVDTYFWSDFQDGITQVQDNLDMLANRYMEAGLAVGNLNVVDGARMTSEPDNKELMPSLLDEFA